MEDDAKQKSERVLYGGREIIAPGSKVFKQGIWHAVFTLLATILFVLTALFARSTFSPATSITTSLKISSTLTILRVLQGSTSTLLTEALNQGLQLIQWSLAEDAKGLSMLSLLSISPTTGIWGLLNLLFRSASLWGARNWAIFRLSAMGLIWVSGIILFVKTSVGVRYVPRSSFNVTAGVGHFNSSFVDNTLRTQNGTISYAVLAAGYSFVSNPQFSTLTSPSVCKSDCDAYLFPGAVWSMRPNPEEDVSSDVVIEIKNSPAVQMEFENGIPVEEQLEQSDCTLYGTNNGTRAIEFCMAKSRVRPGSVIAGVWVCTAGMRDGNCIVDGESYNVTTTFTLLSTRASNRCARRNNTILSVYDIEQPALRDIDVVGLSRALGWLLNFTATGLPPDSSIPFVFWNINKGLGPHDWSIDAFQTLKSILAYPVWLFAQNNFGDPFNDTLPMEFRTSASICDAHDQILINEDIFVTYVVLQSLILFCFWGIIAWRWWCSFIIPELSAYPLVDFAAKLIDRESFDENKPLLCSKLDELQEAESGDTIRVLRDSEVSHIPRHPRVLNGGNACEIGLSKISPHMLWCPDF